MDGRHGDDYDVLIIGARVAGASLALLLGEQGRRVLLVDRDHFPSDTLSTHYMGPFAVPLLGRLGVLADVEAAGFRRITRMRNWVEDCLFEGPIAPAGGFGLAPRRAVLDHLLIEHATRRGRVDFRERTSADGLIEDDGRVVGATVTTAGGTPRAVRARVVVGADGKYSRVAEWVGAERYHEAPALRPAYYGYYHGLTPLPETAVELCFVGDRIGFVFPMQPGVDCLALEEQPEDFDAFRADPRSEFERRFRALPTMGDRFANARLEGKLQGTRGIPNFFRVPHGPGWALTGDAGYLKDPSTGLGMGDALNQAFWLAEALGAALDGADWEATLGGFQRRRDEALLPLYRMTLLFTRMRDAPAEDLAWTRAALSNPLLARLLAAGMPAAVPAAFPEAVQPRVRAAAHGFGAPAPLTAPPASVAAAND